MGNVVHVDFEVESKNIPDRYITKWLPAFHKGCVDPVGWTHHVRIKIYKTNMYFAVQFTFGSGGKGEIRPKEFTKITPLYSADLIEVWEKTFAWLAKLNTHLNDELIIIKSRIDNNI